MGLTASEQPILAPGEVRNVSYAFDPTLDGDETLTAATVAQVGGTDLTLGSTSINGVAVRVKGKSRAVGTVVHFRITVPSSGFADSYSVRVTVTTSAGQTFKRLLAFTVTEE